MYLAAGWFSKKKSLNGEPNVEITQQTALVCVCLSNSNEFSFHHTPSSPFPFFAAWWCNNHLEKYESQWEGWQPKYIMDNNPAMFETTKQFGHGPTGHATCRSQEPISIVVHSIKHGFQLFLDTKSVAQLEGRQLEDFEHLPPRHRQLSSLLPSNIFNQPFLKVSKSILKDRSIILVRAKGGTVQKFWSFWGLLCTFKSGWKRRVPMLGQQLATATWLQPKTRSNFLWGWHHHQQVFCTLVVCSSWFIHWATVTLTSSQSSKVWQSADWPKAGWQIGWYLAALWATTLSDCVLQSSLQI